MRRAAKIALLFAVAAGVLYFRLPRGWWFVDDPELVAYAARAPLSFLWNPVLYQQFSPFNLTPEIMLSLGLDFTLAGLDPFVFYVHQIISLALTSIALFLVVRLYSKNDVIPFGCVMLFLLQPATLGVVSWISTRHYLEGLGFSLFSLYFFIVFMRRGGWLRLAVSVFLYLLAVLCKEVYVPLPLALLLLPEGAAGRRMLQTIPHGLVTALYAAYRFRMLGENTLGGYSTIWPWTVASALRSTPEIFRAYGDSWWPFAAIATVVLWAIADQGAGKVLLRQAARGSLIFLLVYLPIMPVSPLWGGLMSLRYFFLSSVVITIFFALSLEALLRKKGAGRSIILAGSAAVVFLFLCRAFIGQSAAWEGQKAQAAVEGRYFLENRGRDVIFKPLQPHWFFDGIEKVEAIRTGGIGKRWIKLSAGNFFGLDEDSRPLDVSRERVFAYDPASRAVADVTAAEMVSREHFFTTVKEMPLEVVLATRNDTLRLDLGPYKGQYILLESSPEARGYCYLAVEIQRKFGIKLTHRERVRVFRVAYFSPEGWTTISPAFLIDRSKEGTIKWQRTTGEEERKKRGA